MVNGGVVMGFDKIMGFKTLPSGANMKTRTAVRGVIFHEGKLLMILTNKGDYKFPGGGMKQGESVEETLSREVLEETGYQVQDVLGTLGTVLQQQIDDKDDSMYFSMNSIYIGCTIKDCRPFDQQLDDYEEEQAFLARFVTVQEAIKQNEKVLKENKSGRNDWVERETFVLKELLQVAR